MNITKQRIALGISAVLLPLQTFFGAISGYFIAKILAGRETGKKGLFNSFTLNIGAWKLHLHHWMYGLGVALSAVALGINLPFPQFSFGLLAGLVFQGLSDYSDWHRVFIRKRK